MKNSARNSARSPVMIPTYTKGEERFNMISHIVGGALGVVTLVLCVVFAAMNRNVYGIVSGAVFGSCMILLYSVSSIYHGLSPRLSAKRVFRVLDHCAIFLLIAGTYTPFSLCAIREVNVPLGWGYFGVIWGLAAVGVTLCALDMHRFRAISMILYLGMGWCVAFSFDTLTHALPHGGMVLLLAGGVAYTMGAVIFGLGRFLRYAHSVFHLFVLAGSTLHFLAVLLYVL